MSPCKNMAAGALITLAGVLAAWPVAAAEGPEDHKDDTLELVVVTATKRSVDVQKLPEAVTAITSEQLDNLNALTFEDYFRTVPGLMMNQAPGTTRGFDFSLRGISDYNDFSPQQTSATVGQYLDEIPVTAAGQQIDPHLVDIDHIEVLRGPQGTYFGEDSLGGTIRIITKKPDLLDFSGAADGRVSSTVHGGINDTESLMLNIPLISNELGLRLNAFRAVDSGFIDEVCTAAPFPQPQCPATGDILGKINPDRSDGARVQLRFVPADWFSIEGEYIHGKASAQEGAFYEPNIGDLQIASPDALNGLTVVDSNNLGNVTANFNLGWAQLVSASSLGQRTVNEAASGLSVFHHNFTQEVRLVSATDWSQHWDYVVGLYYAHSSNTVERIMMGSQVSGVVDKQDAIFGEVGYKLTSQLSARLGLREERLDYDLVQASTIAALPAIPAISRGTPATTGRFVVSYDVTADAQTYASVSRGFRQGGINQSYYDSNLNGPGQGGANPNIPLAFQPDTTTNYELGWKMRVPSLQATFDAALYHINWQNMQVVGFAPDPGYPNGVQYYHNAGSAHVDGLELEGSMQIVQGLQAQASLALVDPRISQSQPLPQDNPPGYYAPAYCFRGCPAVKGDEIPYVSKISGSMTLNYHHPLGVDDFSGFAVLSEQFTGRRNTDFASTWEGPSQTPVLGCPVTVFGPCPVPPRQVPRAVTGSSNGQFAVIDESFLTNLQLGVSNRSWRVSVYVDNVFNVRNQTLILPADGAPNGNQVLVGRPRTSGLWVRYSF
jgi:iron complex outermembrane recepter protein